MSDVQNISESQVCVTCARKLRVSSLCLCDEYLNTPDLCQSYRISQSLKSVSHVQTLLVKIYLSAMLNISYTKFCVCHDEYLRS